MTAGTGGRACADFPGAPLPGAGGFNSDGVGTTSEYTAGGKGYTSGIALSNSQGGVRNEMQGGWGGGAAAFANTSVIYIGGGGGYTGGDSGDYRSGDAGGAVGVFSRRHGQQQTECMGG